MDKQDQLAAALFHLVDSIEFRTAVADPRGKFGKPEDLIAAAVRSFMVSDEVVMELARAAAALNVATDGMEQLRSERQAVLDGLAALSAAIGEDIGGRRG